MPFTALELCARLTRAPYIVAAKALNAGRYSASISNKRTGRWRRVRATGGADFATNDYLAIANSDCMRRAIDEAMEHRVPTGSGSSRLRRGNHVEHERLEEYADIGLLSLRDNACRASRERTTVDATTSWLFTSKAEPSCREPTPAPNDWQLRTSWGYYGDRRRDGNRFVAVLLERSQNT